MIQILSTVLFFEEHLLKQGSYGLTTAVVP